MSQGTPNSGDRLAQFQQNIDHAIERGELVVVIGVDFAQCMVEIAKAAREQADAVKAILGTLNFYIGPNARTAVSRESVASYERLRDANKAQFAALARLDSGATEGDA